MKQIEQKTLEATVERTIVTIGGNVQTYEKVTKEIVVDRVVACSCDWCRADMEIEDDDALRQVSAAVNHHVTEYDDTNFRSGRSVGWHVEDLCEPCAAKLKQILLDNGVRIVEKDERWNHNERDSEIM